MIGMGIWLAMSAEGSAHASRTEFRRDAVAKFAGCVRRRARDRADALLATRPGSPEEKEKALVIAGAYAPCLVDRTALSFPVELLRGQLAEQGFQENSQLRDRAAGLSGGAPVRIDVAEIEQSVAKSSADRREERFAETFRVAFARCVTAADPKSIAAILPTPTATEAERAALTKAGGALMDCMPQGVAYHINSAELRPYLMSELYYRAVTDTPARAGS